MFVESLCHQICVVSMLYCLSLLWPWMGLSNWEKPFLLEDHFWLHLRLPHEVIELKGSWLNLCIVSFLCSKLGSFFLDPSHFLDFVCCLKLYPHVFFILLLLEQQSLCRWFPDFNKNNGVCALCESVRSFIGFCLGWAVVGPEYIGEFLFP